MATERSDIPFGPFEPTRIPAWVQTCAEQFERALETGQSLSAERKRRGEERFSFKWPDEQEPYVKHMEFIPYDQFLLGVKSVAYSRYLDIINAGHYELARDLLESHLRPQQ